MCCTIKKDPDVNGRIILKLIFEKRDGGMDCCKCGNELSGSIKCGVFLDWFRTW
jgi:hypothetical protein